MTYDELKRYSKENKEQGRPLLQIKGVDMESSVVYYKNKRGKDAPLCKMSIYEMERRIEEGQIAISNPNLLKIITRG